LGKSTDKKKGIYIILTKKYQAINRKHVKGIKFHYYVLTGHVSYGHGEIRCKTDGYRATTTKKDQRVANVNKQNKGDYCCHTCGEVRADN
jgi:hypothetical protein